jgi:hypothetical protein
LRIMTTFLEGIQSGIKSGFCQSLKTGANFAGLFPQGLGAATISDALNGAAGAICSAPPQSGGGSGGGGAGGDWDINLGSEPTFSGGQCEGVTYTFGVVAYNYTNFVGEVTDVSSAGISGPFLGKITSAIVSVRSNPPSPLELIATIQHGGGEAIRILNGQPLNMNSLNSFSFNFPPSSAGGQDCGDPPLTIPPVEEIEETIDVDYDDDDGNPISLPDLPIKFFPPCINLDGIRIPFEIDTPFGKICGKIGLRPDFANVLEPDIDIDLCPSQKEDLGLAESDIENYFEISPPVGSPVASDFDGTLTQNFDLESLPIMGIFINSKNKFPRFEQTILGAPNDADPDLIIPNIGYVQFEYLIQISEGEYQSGFSADIPIKLSQQFIPCPFAFGAVGVRVFWRDNWEGNYRIARRKSCCDSCGSGSPQDALDKIDRCRID